MARLFTTSTPAVQAGSPRVEQPIQGAQECAADESEFLEGLLMLQDGADLPLAASCAQPLRTEEQTELAGEGAQDSSAACCEDRPAKQRCLLEAVAYLEADEASTEAPCDLHNDAGQPTRAAVPAPCSCRSCCTACMQDCIDSCLETSAPTFCAYLCA